MAEVIHIDPAEPSPQGIDRAAAVIQNRGVIIYPTETLYGLGANPLYPDAIERLYTIKGRDQDKPIPFLIKDQEMLADLVEEIPPIGKSLMDRYWPGPLTLIFRAKETRNQRLASMPSSLPDFPAAVDPTRTDWHRKATDERAG